MLLLQVGSALKQPSYRRPVWVKRSISPHNLWTRLSLPDFFWLLLLGGNQRHPRPSMACAHQEPPPTGSAACWPMLRTPPSVLVPIGKLANKAAQAALLWLVCESHSCRRRRVAVMWWGMLPGVSESHSITLSSWALPQRAAGTSRSHLGRSGAWQGAAGRLQLLFNPWQQSSISVSQLKCREHKQSRTYERTSQTKAMPQFWHELVMWGKNRQKNLRFN